MNLKQLVGILPLIASFLIFNGFLKLYIFYGHWNINIIDYLDLSEILLSFLNDLNILIVGLIFFLIHQILGVKLVETADKKLSGKIPIPSTNIVQNNADTPQQIMTHSAQPISDILKFIFEKKTLLMWVIALILTIIFVLLFLWSNKMIWLYPAIFSILQFLMISFENSILASEKLSWQVSAILTFLAFTSCIAIYDIKEVKRKSVITTTTITVVNEIIVTTPYYYLLGKTQKFIYLSDNKKSKTLIIPVDNIKKIETRIH